MANIVEKKDGLSVLKNLLNSGAMKRRIEDAMGDGAGAFLTSILDLYSSDVYLSKCDPTKVAAECMKAAALKLPISKGLGFCYIIAYGTNPQFQMGYKGLIQLAQRSGQYKYLNADCVFEGEEACINRLSGMIEISGEPTSDKVIGYFAYFQLVNGFEKCLYWSKERVQAHAEKYSQAKKNGRSTPWNDNFDAMGIKTVLKQLIGKYGVMSVEMVNAFENDNADAAIEKKIDASANKGEPIVADFTDVEPGAVEDVVPANDNPEAVAEDPGF